MTNLNEVVLRTEKCQAAGNVKSVQERAHPVNLVLPNDIYLCLEDLL